MALLVLDPDDQKRLIARRRRLGLDRYDEVWEGTYVMSPLADDEHQDIVGGLSAALRQVVQIEAAGQVRPGVNISDREMDWKSNFRCPDVAAFFPGSLAENRGAFWLGGPDFGVEVRSRGDRSRKKLGFYAKVGTRELLIVDRHPAWGLELYRLAEGRLASAGKCGPGDGVELVSEVVPLAFRLEPVAGGGRPRIVARHSGDGREWPI